MRALVVEHRICSLEYFLDIMREYEVDILMDLIPYSNRELWETARFQAFFTAQANSKKRLKLTDLGKFPWDEKKKKITKADKAELEAMRNNAMKIAEAMNKRGNA